MGLLLLLTSSPAWGRPVQALAWTAGRWARRGGTSGRAGTTAGSAAVSSLAPPRQTAQSIFALHAAARRSPPKSRTVSASAAAGVPYRLVVVESPSKCGTIDKILNRHAEEQALPFRYRVAACYGHVRNLSKEKVRPDPTEDGAARFPYAVPGIDLAHNYRPLYTVIDGKEGIIRELRQLASRSQAVLLATDPDREGEAMAWHLQELLSGRGGGGTGADEATAAPRRSGPPIRRVSFTEITPSAVLRAVLATHDGVVDDEGKGLASSDDDTGINHHLVTAQETRRVLDRLVGFTLSPVLWKKIAPGLSAGRVQSVGMTRVVERERQRLLFEPTEYYSIEAKLTVDKDRKDSRGLTAKLITLNGRPIASQTKDFTAQGSRLVSPELVHLQQDDATVLVDALSSPPGADLVVQTVTSTQVRQSPPQPYRTSTLQQDSNRRLGLSVDQTMRVAQQLYEAGYISYMRTDSSTLSSEAEHAIRQSVCRAFGENEYDANAGGNGGGSAANKNPKKVNAKTKGSFAQEAHEAIRPAVPAETDAPFLQPEQLMGLVGNVELSLYRMIYQRTLASRMQPRLVNRTRAVIQGTAQQGDITVTLRATGSAVISRGYSLVFDALKNEEETEEENLELPPLEEGQVLRLEQLTTTYHETQPPPRFNEASFVKELESLGVGRPSTYASTVKILRERAYVGSPVRDNSRPTSFKKEPSSMAKVAQRAAGGEEFTGGARGTMVPSLSAFAVSDLLQKHCPMIVDPEFTAKMEEQLDWIASGEQPEEYSLQYLDGFYAGDHGLAAAVKRIEEDVIPDDARRVSLPALDILNKTSDGNVSLCVGPWGPFVKLDGQESSKKPLTVPLPANMAADLTLISQETLQALLSAKEAGGLILGQHPDDQRNIRLKTGRYGAYLQWGEDGEEGTTTHSLPKGVAAVPYVDSQTVTGLDRGDEDLDSLYAPKLGLTFEEAVGYVSLPRTVGMLQDWPITAALGPYGPYLKYNNSYASLKPADGDVLTIDFDTAEKLVRDRIMNKSSRGAIAELGEKDGAMVSIKIGRFGQYINWKRVNAKLPVEYKEHPESMPLEEAWELIQQASDASGKTTPKKTKKEKDQTSIDLPPAPKRPKSSYLHFCAAKRVELSNSSLSPKDVTKTLAEWWSQSSDSDKKPYEALAASDKANYQKLMAAWKDECQTILRKAESGRIVTEKSSRKVKGREEPVNKRPKTAYLLFCAEKRPQVASQFKKLGDITKELARLWAETSDRGPYEALAQQEKEQYEAAKELRR